MWMRQSEKEKIKKGWWVTAVSFNVQTNNYYYTMYSVPNSTISENNSIIIIHSLIL